MHIRPNDYFVSHVSCQFCIFLVGCPISIKFTRRIDVGRNETVWGVTKLRHEIYVLCRPYNDARDSCAISVFDDECNTICPKKIEIKEIEYPTGIGSSEKEKCLYVSDYFKKCVWKIIIGTDVEHKIIKWLTTEHKPSTLSISSDGHLLMINESSTILMIYGSDSELIQSIQLPKEVEKPIHAVENSNGNYLIVYRCGEKEEKGRRWWVEGSLACEFGISEYTGDGQLVRRFTPSNKAQELYEPSYISIDSDDRVFVTEYEHDRVMLLDSDLECRLILCPTKEESEETRLRLPFRSCYDNEKKQLIIAGGRQFREGLNVYTLSRK